MATYPNAVAIFNASDMIFCADTNFSFLNELEACSCAVVFFLGSIPSKFARYHLNGPIHVSCNILNLVATSVAEAENGGCCVTGRDVIIP